MNKVTLEPEIAPSGSYSQTIDSDVTVNTCTFTASSSTITTPAAHGLLVGQKVRFTTTGTLPAAITVGTHYYVVTAPTSTTFSVSANSTGSSITMATVGTGTHTVIWTDILLSSKFNPGRLGVYVVVNISLPSGTVVDLTWPDGYVGLEYDFTMLDNIYATISLLGGSLPPGLSYTYAVGLTQITGIPTTVGTYSFTFRYTVDGANFDYEHQMTIQPSAGGGGGGAYLGGF